MPRLTPALRYLPLCMLTLTACGTEALIPNETAPPPADSSPPSLCEEPLTGLVQFPLDEGAHKEDLEWWYYTGHLQDSSGNWYGFEQVFFLMKYMGMDAVMSHHAITDATAQVFEYDVGYGALTDRLNEGSFSFRQNNHHIAGTGGKDTLEGSAGDYSLSLHLEDSRRPVLQHGNGYQDYNFGGYTYYYSRPRMQAQGTLTVNGEVRDVQGTVWFDHQWGALNNATKQGWDWFSLQLEDGRDVMVFSVRGERGANMLSGSITDKNCRTEELSASDISIEQVDTWTSPRSGCTYPMGWKLTVLNETFEVKPVMENQELYHHTKTYWEGAATVSGSATGRAYVEMTEYCN